MRFSLVVATLGRSAEVQKLLESLDRQIHRDFEIIVVDQNVDDRLLPILHAFEGRLEIRRVVSSPGLSRSRNVGLRVITGDALCFPDDDCWYPADVLSRVTQLLTEHPEWHGLIGDSVDQSGQPTLPWRDREDRLTSPMSWRRSISYGIFLRSAVIRAIGGFDEGLGLGSGTPWGSGEDNDLVLRALKAGCYVRYDPSIHVYHPKLFPVFDKGRCAKGYSYALGDGKLLQKHPMPLWWRLPFFAVPLCRAMLSLGRLNTKETYFHWLTFKGRFKGFVSARDTDHAGVLFPAKDPSTAVDVATNKN